MMQLSERETWETKHSPDVDEALSTRNSRLWLYKLNRLALSYLCEFHFIDFTTSEQQGFMAKVRLYVRKLRFRAEQGHGRGQQQRRRRATPAPRLGLPTWPYVLLCLYLYAALTISVNLYYQFQYDIEKRRLRQFRAYLNQSRMHDYLVKNYDPDQFQAASEQRTQTLRSALKAIGAPHLEWAMLVECVYSYLLESSLIAYLLVSYSMSSRSPILSAFRFFLDESAAARSRAELTRRELKRMAQLSKIYTETQISWLLRLAAGDRTGSSWPDEPDAELASLSSRGDRGLECNLFSNLSRDANKLSQRHLLTVKQLRLLASAGRLRPFNRSDAWLHLYAVLNLCVFIFTFAYSIFCTVFFYMIAHRFYSRTTSVELHTWRDWVVLFSAACLLFTIMNSAAFQCVVLVMNNLDQLKTIHEIGKLIRGLHASNERRLSRLQALLAVAGHELEPESRASLSAWATLSAEHADTARARPNHHEDLVQIRSLVANIELDLLAAVLHLRLFNCEFGRVRRALGSHLTGCAVAVGWLLVILRLLMPYFDARLKSYAFGVTVCGTAPLFLVALPLCHLFSRCLAIYIRLWSLLAQLAQVESSPPLASALSIGFVISLLRKELAHTDLFSNRYAVRALSIRVTYANLLRTIFYASLVMVSLFDRTSTTNEEGVFEFDDSRRTELVYRFLGDPLRVFKF